MKAVAEQDRERFQQLDHVRTAALTHARQGRKLSAQRRQIIKDLVGAGCSQTDIAREMGVTRQSVQKMLSAG